MRPQPDQINNSAHIVILLENASNQAEPLSRITLIRLIEYLESDLIASIKPKVKSILENEKVKIKFDKQLTDLLYLAKEIY